MPPQPKVIVADHASTKDVELAMVEPPSVGKSIRLDNIGFEFAKATLTPESKKELDELCLLYTSDAADERSSVDLGGRRIIKKKKKKDRKKNKNKQEIHDRYKIHTPTTKIHT